MPGLPFREYSKIEMPETGLMRRIFDPTTRSLEWHSGFFVSFTPSLRKPRRGGIFVENSNPYINYLLFLESGAAPGASCPVTKPDEGCSPELLHPPSRAALKNKKLSGGGCVSTNMPHLTVLTLLRERRACVSDAKGARRSRAFTPLQRSADWGPPKCRNDSARLDLKRRERRAPMSPSLVVLSNALGSMRDCD